jgi:hypothetical protein
MELNFQNIIWNSSTNSQLKVKWNFICHQVAVRTFHISISVRPNKFLNAAFRRFEAGIHKTKGRVKHFYRVEISIIGLKVKESGI